MANAFLRRLSSATLFLFSPAGALEAKWTPNGDGPARFSKRYRDAAGIDDSRWIGEDDSSAAPWLQVFPSTLEGWCFAILAMVGLCYLYMQQQQQQQPVGQNPTRPNQPNVRPGEAGAAGEAARAAFLRKYGDGEGTKRQ